MIKTTVTNGPNKPEYPVLKEETTTGENKGAIVLFTSPGTGVVVVPAGNLGLAAASSQWDEKRCFEPFGGSVILSNE